MWIKIKNWLDVRIGLGDLVQTKVIDYRIPKNINIFYTLGFIAVIAYAVEP